MSLKFFNFANQKQINAEIHAAIKQIAEKYDLALELRNSKATQLNLDYEVRVAVKNAAGQGMSPERMKFESWCKNYGLDAAHYRAIFMFKGRRYRIEGINPGAPRFPIEAIRVDDGKQYRFPVQSVKAGLVPVAKTV